MGLRRAMWLLMLLAREGERNWRGVVLGVSGGSGGVGSAATWEMVARPRLVSRQRFRGT
jgi:hypothetical protein